MRKLPKSKPPTLLRGGERLEDRRLLAFAGGACNLRADPLIPEQITAFGQTLEVGDIEPVTRRQQPRLALLDTPLQLPERFTYSTSLKSSIDPESTGCRRVKAKGLKTTGLLIFDFQDERNFKFAGFDARRNLWLIGKKHQNRFNVHDRLREKMTPDQTYQLDLHIDGPQVELIVNDERKVSHTFRTLNLDNPLGLGTLTPKATDFQNVEITDYFPLTQTVEDHARLTQGEAEVIDVLANDIIAYDVDALLSVDVTEHLFGDISVVNNQLHYQANSNSFGEERIEYRVTDQFGRSVNGELAVTISSELPLNYEFDDSELATFQILEGDHTTIENGAERLLRLTGLELLNLGIPPEQFTMTTTVVPHPDKPRANGGGYFVFDYADLQNYKYAGILAGKKTAVIAEVQNGRVAMLKTKYLGKPENYEYNLRLLINGNQVRLLVNDTQYISRQFHEDVTHGQIGLKGHRRGSIFRSLRLDDINQPAVGLNHYHKIPVHQDVTLNHLIDLPQGAVMTGASAAHGTVTLHDNQLTYRSAAHHWGPTTIEYSLEFENGTAATRTLPIAPGVSFPASAELTPFGHLDSDVVMNDYGFAVQGKQFFQENQYPLPFGGFETVTNFNMLFLDDLLPRDFDIILQYRDVNEQDFAQEPIIFDYRDQLNYKFVGMTRVVDSNRSSTLVGSIVNSVLYPDRTFWAVGEVVNGEERILDTTKRSLNLGNRANLRVKVRDHKIQVYLDSSRVTTYEFSEALRFGAVGAYSPYSDRAYQTLNIVPADATLDPQSYNTRLQGDMWHFAEDQIEVQPDANGMSVHMLSDSFIGPQQLVTHVVTLRNLEDYSANAFVAFDYIDDANYKVAGIRVGGNTISIGEVVDGELQMLRNRNYVLHSGRPIKLQVSLDGSLASLTIDDLETITYDFAEDNLGTQFGFASDKSHTYFKNTSIESA